MTQKQLLEAVLAELGNIKKDMPNGELKSLVEDVKELKEDMSDLKYTLLNPEDGVIVKTNKNTYFRKENADKVEKISGLVTWKATVTKALWILFTAIVGVAVKVVSMS